MSLTCIVPLLTWPFALIGIPALLKFFEAADHISVNHHDQVTVMDRTALVYKPNATGNGTTSKSPAIFVLHGSGDIAAGMIDKGFEPMADLHNFLVVYPEMMTPRADEWGYNDDIPYFIALLHRLQEKYNLDPARVFVCGHSAGGSMTLFLQNEMSQFCAAGAVESAVGPMSKDGQLHQWDMSKSGQPTMVVWNHADPVLTEYAPPGGEPAYYNLTVSTLRRHGSQNFVTEPLPTSSKIVSAELLTYPSDAAPELRVLSFTSTPGTHAWADQAWCTFSATAELVKFFLGLSCNEQMDTSIVV